MAEGGDFFSAGDAPLFFIAVGVFHVQPAARREAVFGQAAVFQHGGGEAGFFRRFFFGEGIAVVVDAQFQSGGEDAVYLFIETAVQVAFAPAQTDDDEGSALFFQGLPGEGLVVFRYIDAPFIFCLLSCASA